MRKIFIEVLTFTIYMKRTILTKNEKKVLYGLVTYPEKNDSELSKVIDVKPSTFTSIKRRLYDQDYYRTLNIPLLNNLGCEMLAVIYTQFNPVIPLKERIEKTKSTIEVFDEIFYSIGEQEKGFSISLSKNYTSIGKINDIRTETFGSVGLLEKEYPNEIVFPFEISKIIRFFDFSRILKEFFGIDNFNGNKSGFDWFSKVNYLNLNEKEKKVYVSLLQNPNYTTQKIGDIVDLSRHTVARIKKDFFNKNLLKKLTIPNLRKLGFEILAFYPIKFNPGKYPSEKDISMLDTNSTLFFARRKFEVVIVSAYPTYQMYKEDKMHKIRFLKENDFISFTPLIGKYVYDRISVIKDFNFAPISKKILNLK